MRQKKVFVLVTVAFLCALEIVLNRFFSYNALGLKIGFSFIPGVIAAIVYGPFAAAAVNGVGDFLGATLFPIGQYHPGFTVCAALMGLLNGLFLHRNIGEGGVLNKKQFFANVLPPVLINNLGIGLFANTLWISMLYTSKGYWGYFWARLATEYSVLVPMQLILIPLLFKLKKPLLKIVNKR